MGMVSLTMGNDIPQVLQWINKPAKDNQTLSQGKPKSQNHMTPFSRSRIINQEIQFNELFQKQKYVTMEGFY